MADDNAKLLEEIDSAIGETKSPSLRNLLERARGELAGIQAALDDAQEENRELEERCERHDTDVGEAVNNFLDVVDRPCGTRKFIIPETGERDRALIGLYDAIGRRL